MNRDGVRLGRILEGMCPSCGGPLERQDDCGWCDACGFGHSASWSGKSGTVSLHIRPRFR